MEQKPSPSLDEKPIQRVTVIGAGAMGSGIAAQFANAGIPVDLLDIAGPDATDRNAPARGGVERQLKAGGFMHPSAAHLVRVGNISDDLAYVSDADWIVEAVIEKLDIKRDLYRKLNPLRKAGSIISSNTSTIPRAELVEGAPDGFAEDFVITHFFNPPRVMRLVELVGGEESRDGVLERARTACEVVLGKTVVDCRDTPGFIANRIGCFWIAAGILEAKRRGLTVEEADTAMTALGIPKTGVFGVTDLIGVDLVPHVWGSLMRMLPPTDAIHQFDLPGDDLVRDMIGRGLFGRKAKAGFYRLAPDKSREVMDLQTGVYRAEQPVKLAVGGRDVAAFLRSGDRLSDFALTVLARVMHYAGTVGPEMAGDVGAIDTAMMLGYAWKHGPFALADLAGIDIVKAEIERLGLDIPPLLNRAANGFFDSLGASLQTDGDGVGAIRNITLLRRAKNSGKPILSNEAASLWDIGEGIACFEMHTKLNNFAPAVFEILEPALAYTQAHFAGLVLGNDDPRAFSVGADLRTFSNRVKSQDWAGLNDYIQGGQDLMLRMKYTPFPVVAAAHGFALGGGCEFMLNTRAIVAHCELTAGLPETKVGIIPGWGGGTQLLVRAAQNPALAALPLEQAKVVFDIIWGGNFSKSALDARAMGILGTQDTIVMNRDRLLLEARTLASALSTGYVAPAPAEILVTGKQGYEALMEPIRGQHASGALSENDVAIAHEVAYVLSGGAMKVNAVVSEEYLMRLEREANMTLAKRDATVPRMEHMLATGKPLRN